MKKRTFWAALVPELIVRDVATSVAFYEAIGFKVRFSRSSPRFAYLCLGRAQIMLEEEHLDSWTSRPLEHPRGRGVNLQIECASVDRVLRRVREFRLPLFEELQESWYEVDDGEEEGQREFLIQDPDGYLLRFCEPLRRRVI